MRLQEEGRELIYKGALNKRGGAQGDSGDLQMYLFDHALLMVKQKSKHEQYKVYRRVGTIYFPHFALNSPSHLAHPLGTSSHIRQR